MAFSRKTQTHKGWTWLNHETEEKTLLRLLSIKQNKQQHQKKKKEFWSEQNWRKVGQIELMLRNKSFLAEKWSRQVTFLHFLLRLLFSFTAASLQIVQETLLTRLPPSSLKRFWWTHHDFDLDNNVFRRHCPSSVIIECLSNHLLLACKTLQNHHWSSEY